MSRCNCPGKACTCLVEVHETSTLKPAISGNGNAGTPYDISGDVKVSADTGNQVAVHTDGLFVPPSSVSVQDSDCIELSGTGLVSDPIIATPVIAPEPNGLTCGPTGLVVKPSTDANNALVMGSDGNLYANNPTVDDTPTVNMEITPAGLISSNVNISADTGNTLVVEPDGLFVPPPTLGCGLEFNGPDIQANVQAWPFGCPIGSNGGGIYCDPATGELRGDPSEPTRWENTSALQGSTPIGPGGETSLNSPTLTIDLSASCFNWIIAFQYGYAWDVTAGAADNWETTVQLFIDGAGQTNQQAYRNSNTPNAVRLATRDQSFSQSAIFAAAGSVHTVFSQTRLHNLGSTNITQNSIYAYVSYVAYPQTP